MPVMPGRSARRPSSSPAPQPRSTTTAGSEPQALAAAVATASMTAAADPLRQQARSGRHGFAVVAGVEGPAILRLEQIQVAAAGEVEGVPAVAGVGGAAPRQGLMAAPDAAREWSRASLSSTTPDPKLRECDQAQISASVGTFLFVITLPMRDTFIRCL